MGKLFCFAVFTYHEVSFLTLDMIVGFRYAKGERQEERET